MPQATSYELKTENHILAPKNKIQEYIVKQQLQYIFFHFLGGIIYYLIIFLCKCFISTYTIMPFPLAGGCSLSPVLSDVAVLQSIYQLAVLLLHLEREEPEFVQIPSQKCCVWHLFSHGNKNLTAENTFLITQAVCLPMSN